MRPQAMHTAATGRLVAKQGEAAIPHVKSKAHRNKSAGGEQGEAAIPHVKSKAHRNKSAGGEQGEAAIPQ